MNADIMKEKVKEFGEDPSLLEHVESHQVLYQVIEQLEAGTLRLAGPSNDGVWVSNPWIIDAISLCFRAKEYGFQLADLQEISDKHQRKIRKLAGSLVRAGCHIGDGVVLMPSFVNMGSYVGDETMVDTWATIGLMRPCAEIIKDVDERAASKTRIAEDLRK